MSLYFAFGSCMDLKDLRRTVPQAEFVGVGRIDNYKLAFTRYSIGRKGGVADIVKSRGDYVEGIMFYVPNFRKLDGREGHPYAYRRRRIKVTMADGSTVWASTYVVADKTSFEIEPSKYYCSLIFRGAEQLSVEYQIKLYENIHDIERVRMSPRKQKPLRTWQKADSIRQQLLEYRMGGIK